MIRSSRGGTPETGMALLLAAVLALFGPATFLCNGLLNSARPSLKNDFTSYYVAGLAVRDGRPDALYYPEPVGSLLAQASQQHPWIDLARPAGIEHPNYYLYPPLFAVLFAPLTLLPYKAAYLAWVLLGVGCLAAATALALRRLERPDASARAFLAAAGTVLIPCLFYPVTRTLAVGQSSLLLLLLMAVALAGLGRRSRGGDLTAGACLAAGIMLKLTPVLFLPWLLLRRRLRALAWCGASFALLLALSIALVGFEPHRLYFGRMVGMLSGGTAFYPNQSLTGAALRLAGADWRLADLAAPGSAPVQAARAMAILILAATFVRLFLQRRGTAPHPGGPPSGAGEEREFGALLMASLLVSPISWEHHYVMALLPAWNLLREKLGAAEERRTTPAVLDGIALALMGSYVGLRVIGAPGEGAFGQVAAATGLMGGLLLWGRLLFARDAALPGPAGVTAAPVRARPAIPAALLAMLAAFAGGIFLLKLAEYGRSYSYGDFTSYYVAAATLVEGRGESLYHPDTPDMILARAVTPGPWTETAARAGVKDANYYLYPPFFAMAMMPLALLPYAQAHTLWYLVNLLALGGAILIWLRRVRRGDGAAEEIPIPLHGAMAILLVALSWPALFTFGAGQANYIVLLCLMGGISLLASRREPAAGLAVAAAAGIKLTPVILLPWMVARRQWRATLAAGAALVLLVLAGGWCAGWDSYTVYREKMLPLLSRGCAHWVNQSPLAFFTRLLDGGDPFSWAIADPSALSRIASSTVGLLLAGASAWGIAGRMRRGQPPAWDLEIALLAVASLFISPISWTHHSVISLAGFLIAARELARRGEVTRATTAWFAIAFTMVNLHVKPPGIVSRGLPGIVSSYNLAGNLLLWALLLRLLAGGTPPLAAPAGERR